MQLRGHERHRRAAHHVGDRRELLGCRLRGGDESRDGLGCCRQDQQAADDLVDLVQAEAGTGWRRRSCRRRRGWPRTGPGATARRPAAPPRRRSRRRPPAGCRWSGRACGPGSPRRRPASARRGRPSRCRRSPTARPCRTAAAVNSPAVRPVSAQAVRPVDVDVDGRHVPQVEHDAAVDDAVAGGAVPAAADGERQTRLAGQRDGPHDVRIHGRAHDQGRSGLGPP